LSLDHPNPNPPGLDWDEVRSRMRRRLVGRLDAADRSELDDLIQEGCIRLLRALRREKIDDLEAFITVLIDRTFTDFLRRRYRNRRLLSFSGDDAPEPVDPKGIKDHLSVDLLERIEFVVVGIFESEDRAECAELARHWFAARDWKWVAEQLDRGHDAIRKQWSRCLEVPRRVLGRDPFYRHLFSRRNDDHG
jgi:DNA-directed RNA polymerase specialized sigma24 family protein